MVEIRQKQKVGLALCMVMLLTACGQQGGNMEPQGEITVMEDLSESSEDSDDEIIVLPEQETAVVGGEADSGNAIAEADTEIWGCADEIYQEILEYDFSVQEYPIDTTRYTADVEKEFLKAFHDVLTNRVPMEYRDSGEAYFYRDHLGRYFSYLSDKGFVELFVKKSPYRLIDMDGDGLPELAVAFEIDDFWVFGGICVLKYNMEEKRVTSYYFELSEGWGMLLLGSNRFGLYDTGDIERTGTDRTKYLVIDEQAETVQSFDFEVNTMDETKFTVSGIGETNVEAVVTEEEWAVLTEDFFDAMANPIEFMTYEEVFGDAADYTEESADEEEMLQVYQEFLAGERRAGNVTIDMIAGMSSLEGSAKEAEYLICDVTGDDISELLIWAKEKYYILTYQSGVLFVLRTLSTNYYEVLENGMFLEKCIQGDNEFFLCYQVWTLGFYRRNSFRRTDLNGDGVYDETDQYECEDTRYQDDPPVMRIVTMEEWLEEIEGYLYVDEDGTVKAIESLEWKAYSGE